MPLLRPLPYRSRATGASRRSTVRAALAPALLLAALQGCGGDGTAPTPVDPGLKTTCAGTPATLPTGFAPSGAGLQALGGGAIRCRNTAEVAVRGQTAYTSTWGLRAGVRGDMVYVWDVAGAVPQLVDSAQVPGANTTGDVHVSDDGALLVVAKEHSPGGIAVFSLANPRKPVLLSFFATGSMTPGVHTADVARVGGVQYAFLSVNPSGPGNARLVVVDLSTPDAPREVLAQAMGDPFIHDVFVRDGVLFTALWDQGLAIWDIGGAGRGGSPSAPVMLGNVQTVNGNVHNAWWFHDPGTNARRYLFVGEEGPAIVGSSSSGDLHVVDVSDLTQPREVAFFHVAGAGVHNVSMDEARGVLYAAFYNGGVRALDVRGDLGTCTAAQQSADGRCDLGLMGREMARGLTGGIPVYVWSALYAGGAVYASDMPNGLWKLSPVTR